MPSSALHVARTGLEAQDARMRVIANNLANVGTNGFKRDRANFSTLAYQDARVAASRARQTAYATGLNSAGVGIHRRRNPKRSSLTPPTCLDMALMAMATSR
jgi:flagellar basal-body rod protein FlgG